MRFLFIATLLLFSFACTKKANTNLSAEDFKSIKVVLDSQVSAWNKGDIKTFMKGYWNSDSLLFTQISGNDKIANVTGQWKITGTNNAGGFFSLLFKKVETDWKIIVDHTW